MTLFKKLKTFIRHALELVRLALSLLGKVEDALGLLEGLIRSRPPEGPAPEEARAAA